jgi:hypothetical protein
MTSIENGTERAMCSSSSLEGGGLLVSTRRYRTISNLIWGKPGLEEQAEGLYDASGGPPSSEEGKDTHAILPLEFTDNLNGVVL